VTEGFPVFVYAQDDQSRPSTESVIMRLKTSGARVVQAGRGGLDVGTTLHPLLQPILMIQSAYLAIEATARQLGRNPDAPRMLRKVTETV
jgi:glutamine---fructose-6-phosphate transaminase (isomerizing)